jgi:hypothetical protein
MTIKQQRTFSALQAERRMPQGFSHPAWDDVYAATVAGTANTQGASWVIGAMLTWPRK